MDFKDVEDFDIEVLEEFRNWAYPQAVSNPDHQLYFSLDNPTTWATLDALKLFLRAQDDPEAATAAVRVAASVKDLKAFRTLFLPRSLLMVPYFSLENRENWIKPHPLRAFQNLERHHRRGNSFSAPIHSTFDSVKPENRYPSPFPTDSYTFDDDGLGDPWSTTPSGTSDNPVLIIDSDSEPKNKPNPTVSQPKPRPSTIRSKRKRHQKPRKAAPDLERETMAPNTIVISSDSDSDLPDLDFRPEKRLKRRASTADSDYRVSKLESDGESDTIGRQDPILKSSQDVTPPRIYITRCRWVSYLTELDEIPDVWTVPRDKSAYLLDLSKNPLANDKTIESLIRHEAQDSWKVDSGGSSDRAKGDATCLKGILATSEVRVRRITAHCRGVKICSQFPKENWSGMERYEPELDLCQELRTKRLNAHEQEQYNIRPTSQFYRQIVKQRCGVPNCLGRAVIRKSSKRSTSTGQEHFIGCSAWSRAAGHSHLYSIIPANVDVAELQHMLSNDETYAILRAELEDEREDLRAASAEASSTKARLSQLKELGISATSSGPLGEEFCDLSDFLDDLKNEIKDMRASIKTKELKLQEFRDENNLKHTRLPSSKGKERANPSDNHHSPMIPSNPSATANFHQTPTGTSASDIARSAWLHEDDSIEPDLGLDTPIDESFYLGSPAKSRSSRFSTPHIPTSPPSRSITPSHRAFKPATLVSAFSTPKKRMEVSSNLTARLTLSESDFPSPPLIPSPELGEAVPGPSTSQHHRLRAMQSAEAQSVRSGVESTVNPKRSPALLSSAGIQVHSGSLEVSSDVVLGVSESLLECNSDRPEDWLTPNKSQTIKHAWPSLWTFMVDPDRLGG